MLRASMETLNNMSPRSAADREPTNSWVVTLAFTWPHVNAYFQLQIGMPKDRQVELSRTDMPKYANCLLYRKSTVCYTSECRKTPPSIDGTRTLNSDSRLWMTLTCNQWTHVNTTKTVRLPRVPTTKMIHLMTDITINVRSSVTDWNSSSCCGTVSVVFEEFHML